jgi:hypothetical protein
VSSSAATLRGSPFTVKAMVLDEVSAMMAHGGDLRIFGRHVSLDGVPSLLNERSPNNINERKRSKGGRNGKSP